MVVEVVDLWWYVLGSGDGSMVAVRVVVMVVRVARRQYSGDFCGDVGDFLSGLWW